MNIAIILSGGVGTRMGLDKPKQYVEVNGIPIISYCLQTFINNNKTDALVVVCASEWQEYMQNQIEKLQSKKPVYFAVPGETRQYSIYSGLTVVDGIASVDDVVIIHDAARPLVSNDLINRCYDACARVDGVLPVIRVKDTLYRSVDGVNISSLLNRNELFAGQAPEAFRFGKYLDLHKRMSRDELLKINGSTEIAYKGGLNIKLIKGEDMNFKITTQEDLSSFTSIIESKEQ